MPIRGKRDRRRTARRPSEPAQAQAGTSSASLQASAEAAVQGWPLICSACVFSRAWPIFAALSAAETTADGNACPSGRPKGDNGMQNLTVDGQNLTAGDVAGANLEEILINLMEHPSTNGRVITGVKLNGSPYSEEVPHAALEVERETIDSLSLDTLTLEDLGLNFLKTGPAYLAALLEALPKIVENFRLGDEQEANEHFLNFLEALHLLMTLLEQTRHVLGLWQGGDEEDSSSLNQYLESLAKILNTLIALQEQKDWIFLADVLEYELQDSLRKLAALLPQLCQGGH
ncbi:MAG: hypothetical protein LBU12_03060 [Deltaproteobacteria bacterium]|jgi:hypothetical protein|nr:hypothetical protein [Deltaproteobacteria bacterium]